MIENAARDAYGQATPDTRLCRRRHRALRRGDAGQRVRRRHDAASPRWTRWWPILQVLGRLTGAAYENTAAPEQEPGSEKAEDGGLSDGS